MIAGMTRALVLMTVLIELMCRSVELYQVVQLGRLGEDDTDDERHGASGTPVRGFPLVGV